MFLFLHLFGSGLVLSRRVLSYRFSLLSVVSLVLCVTDSPSADLLLTLDGFTAILYDMNSLCASQSILGDLLKGKIGTVVCREWEVK